MTDIERKLDEAIADIEKAEMKVSEKAGILKGIIGKVADILAMLNPFDDEDK